MTNHVCPFAEYKEVTFYPNGNLKSMTIRHPIGKIGTIGSFMSLVAASVNGLVAYFSGNNFLP